ncbi:hypothetical protein ACP70R_039605 [Stipagrostis hirtigluma subsp. patula]
MREDDANDAASNGHVGQDPKQFFGYIDPSTGANITRSNFTTDMYANSSSMVPPLSHGGYTGLLLGVDQHATLLSTARKLQYDETGDHATFKD